MNQILSIKNLEVCFENISILKGINLNINAGEVHAIMGPNGCGKSTLAYTLMGQPEYRVVGEIVFDGQDLKNLSVDKRAKLGIFLAFQAPCEIEGANFFDVLRQSYNALYNGTDKQLSLNDFRKLVNEKIELLKIKKDFTSRDLNVGFSGGEKKQAEVLQLAVLKPKFIILDEIDSGLDIDALKNICFGINKLKEENPNLTILIITHYQRILDYIYPNFVHVMQDGKIVKTGGKELAELLEKEGY